MLTPIRKFQTPHTTLRLALAVAPLLVACGGMVTTDGGAADARSEAASSDAMQRDTVQTDSTPPDATVLDATTMDVADQDVSTMDADRTDSARGDATQSDSSRSDAGGTPDAMPIAHNCPTTYPRLNLRTDFGAVGDGTADDTDALRNAATAIHAAGGGELLIPPGIYRIGRQASGAVTGQPYFRAVGMFSVDGVNCLQVSGYGATLRITAGLHYGAFSATSPTPVPGPTTDPTARAEVGRMIEVTNSSNVLIEGLELDGNNTALVLGGQWGNVDRQIAANGIWLNRNHDAHVMDVHTHHHGLDGIAVEYIGGPPPSRMPQLLERVNSEFNGRQGISWIGGWGLEAIDCQFNHTGRAINHGGGIYDGMPVVSLPRAGLDIEPNAGTTQASRDGQFTRCEFVDNVGAGMVAASGDGGYSTFTDCTFWGTTSYSVWANRPGLRFVNSRFYGLGSRASDGHTDTDPAPNPALATVFEGCSFEDRPWTNGMVYRGGYLYSLAPGEGEGVTWRNCTFTANQVRSVYIDDTSTTEIFDGCTFDHRATLTNGTYQAMFRGSRITSCHFTESPAVAAGTRNYFVSVNSVAVGVPAAGASPTRVDGPSVRWQSTTGPIGTIAPGSY